MHVYSVCWGTARGERKAKPYEVVISAASARAELPYVWKCFRWQQSPLTCSLRLLCRCVCVCVWNIGHLHLSHARSSVREKSHLSWSVSSIKSLKIMMCIILFFVKFEKGPRAGLISIWGLSPPPDCVASTSRTAKQCCLATGSENNSNPNNANLLYLVTND